MTAGEGFRRLAGAFFERSQAPPLLPERSWAGPPEAGLRAMERDSTLQAWQRVAAAVIGDRPREALGEVVAEREALYWQAVALRRAEQFQAARRAFRELGAVRFDRGLHSEALKLLRAPGPGFRWAVGAADHLAARGDWDPVWFVDACASIHYGVLSPETGVLLEEIQWAELRLLLIEGVAG